MQLYEIQNIVEEYFKMKIAIRSRRRNLVDARKIYFMLSKKFTKNSLSTLGASLNGRDHATALHNINSGKNLLETDRNFNYHYRTLYNKVRKHCTQELELEKINTPKVIHPGRLRYGKEKSLYKFLNKRR